MSKITDDQIRAIHLRQQTGEETARDACKRLHISENTYYKRLRHIRKKIKEGKESLEEVEDTLPLTIQQLDQEAERIVQELKSIQRDKLELNEHLAVIDREIRMITQYRAALSSAKTYIDNRQQTVNVTVEMRDQYFEEDAEGLYFPVFSEELGFERAKLIMDKVIVLREKELKRWQK
jgi:septal ring factor EnvC (AmiA/AmiB activator)